MDKEKEQYSDERDHEGKSEPLVGIKGLSTDSIRFSA